MSEKIFTNGLWFNKKEKAPSYVIGSLSIKVPDFIPFIEQNQNNSGYINIDIKQSQKGAYYCELNTWKPTQDKAQEELENQEELNAVEPNIDPITGNNTDEIPF
jgi:hypothetical protein